MARGDIVRGDNVAEKLMIASDLVLCDLERSIGLDMPWRKHLDVLVPSYEVADPVTSDESIVAAFSVDNLCEVSDAAFTRRPASDFII
jgi:hypothetical protein